MPLIEHGVTIADAYLEAATIATSDRAMLDAFALHHPVVGTQYFVNDHADLSATLEDGVTVVVFVACPVRIRYPDESDQASTPQITLEVDNISGAVSDALALIRGSLEPWVLTNYLYASDDTSGPAVLPPTVMDIHTVTVNAQSASLTGTFGDAGNLAIPALTFKRSEYPGLIR